MESKLNLTEEENKDNKEELSYISDYQNEVAEWSNRNFLNNEKVDPLLGIGEEIGELKEAFLSMLSLTNLSIALGRLDHAFLKAKQGIRLTPEKARELMEDALGDIFVYMCDFSQRNNISLEDAISKTWSGVKKRDWIKNKKDGVTEPILTLNEFQTTANKIFHGKADVWVIPDNVAKELEKQSIESLSDSVLSQRVRDLYDSNCNPKNQVLQNKETGTIQMTRCENEDDNKSMEVDS